ncbi:hypothetical protein J4458_02345 [Candidatus Woesearchaeota archaeon]|nr:hypothetical protein [Candidatus Woesearchaeota archaeon]
MDSGDVNLEGRLGGGSMVVAVEQEQAVKIREIRDLRLDWAEITPITISEVGHEEARRYLQVLNNTEKPIDTHVYLCSDVRNEVLRVILSQIPGVATYNTAGNTLYNSQKKPTVVIAHEVCGAVKYAREHGLDDHAHLEAFKTMVDGDAIENAKRQLHKVEEAYRAGVLFFDHAKGRIFDVPNQHYARSGTRLKLLEELKPCLEEWYTKRDIDEFASGQDPNIILVNNVHSSPTGFGIFQIDLQLNSFDPIIRDSLYYAMTHALNGNGNSFAHTKSTIFAFRQGRDLPTGLREFLSGEDQTFIRDYIGRGGSVFLARIGDTPSQKAIYQLKIPIQNGPGH